MAPTLRRAVGANCLLRAGDVDVLIDFPAGRVRAHDGEPYAFRFDIARDLVETVVAERAVDWSNSLFLSCRFRAWRAGEFNEYLYNFFKSLSAERMRRTEDEARRKLDPPTSDELRAEPDIELGDWIVQRRCPHRQADLAAFGEIEGETLVCTLHGWRFDLTTGRCLNAADRPLRVRRRTASS
jgi:UDP-MurNAc hydroxylase